MFICLTSYYKQILRELKIITFIFLEKRAHDPAF